MPSVGAAASVDTGTDWSLASVAGEIGVPAGGDAWSTVPEPDPPPATLTITRTATTSTTSAMATIPYVRVRARRASWAARCLASWRSVKRWLEDFFFAVAADGFFFGVPPEDPGRLLGMTALFSLGAVAGEPGACDHARPAGGRAPGHAPWNDVGAPALAVKQGERAAAA